MEKITSITHEEQELEVWGPPYGEVLERAKELCLPYRKGKPLVLFADLAHAPDPPWPQALVEDEEGYRGYLERVARLLAQQGFLRERNLLDLGIYLFLYGEAEEPKGYEGQRLREKLSMLEGSERALKRFGLKALAYILHEIPDEHGCSLYVEWKGRVVRKG